MCVCQAELSSALSELESERQRCEMDIQSSNQRLDSLTTELNQERAKLSTLQVSLAPFITTH